MYIVHIVYRARWRWRDHLFLKLPFNNFIILFISFCFISFSLSSWAMALFKGWPRDIRFLIDLLSHRPASPFRPQKKAYIYRDINNRLEVSKAMWIRLHCCRCVFVCEIRQSRVLMRNILVRKFLDSTQCNG